MIDASIYTRLTTNTAVAALVGTAIYPVHAPQNAAPPWIRWQRISRTTGRALDLAEGLVETRLQFDCIGDTYTSARNLAVAVQNALQNWSDVNAGIVDAACVNNRDYYGQIADKFYFTSALDFIVTHQTGV